MTFKNSFDRIREDMAELKEMARALIRNQIPSPTSPIPEAPTMADNFGIQHHDNFYFGEPPTDLAVLGASPSTDLQFGSPMTENPNFGRTLATNCGAPWADCEAYETNLGVSSVNDEIASSIHPTSSNFHPPLSYHYEAPPPMSTYYRGQLIGDASTQSFMSSQEESFYQDSFYRDSNFGVHQHNSSNFGIHQQSNPNVSFSFSRTVLVKIHSEFYPISHEELDWLFSGIGKVESIECFDQYSPFHSRICFQDRDSAVRAFYWLHGSYIYNGCCRVEVILEAQTIDRVNEMDASNQQFLENSKIYESVKQSSEFEIVDESQDCWVTTLREEIEDSIQDVRQEMDSFPEIVDKVQEWQKEIETSTHVPTLTELQIQFESSKVKFDSQYSVCDDAIERKIDVESSIGEIEAHKIDISEQDMNANPVGKMGSAEVELKIDDTLLSKNSVERNAYKVFEEMPNKKLVSFEFSVDMDDKAMLGVHVDPINFSIVEIIRVVPVPIYDPGGIDRDSENCVASEGKIQACFCEKYELLLLSSADCKGKTMDLLRNPKWNAL